MFILRLEMAMPGVTDSPIRTTWNETIKEVLDWSRVLLGRQKNKIKAKIFLSGGKVREPRRLPRPAQTLSVPIKFMQYVKSSNQA